MTTIEIKISAELAQRLRPYQHDMTRILELGLHFLEAQANPSSEEQSDQVIAILHQAGTVGPDLSTTFHYVTHLDNQIWEPIQAEGKPASDIIIEQRRGLSVD